MKAFNPHNFAFLGEKCGQEDFPTILQQPKIYGGEQFLFYLPCHDTTD